MRFSQSTYRNYFAQAQDDQDAMFKNCVRFSTHQQDADEEKSAVYVHLRNNNCTRKDALMYCKLPHCRVDCTANKIGPSSHRQLHFHKDPIKTYKGWQIAGDIKHNFGKAMYASHTDILVNDGQDTIQRIFNEQEQNSEIDYGKKMRILRDFYDELDRKYNYSKLDQPTLKHKLKELEEEKILRDNIPKFYLKGHGNRYFEVAEMIGRDGELNDKNNLIKEMEAFKTVIPKAQQHNYKLKQKFIDRAFFSDQYEHKVKMDLERRNQIFKQLKKTYRGDVKLDPQNDQNYEAYQAYKEDYNKSKYFVDSSSNSTSTEKYYYANLKMLRSKQLKNNLTNTPSHLKPENSVTSQQQQQLRTQNSFIEFEAALDEMALTQQRKITLPPKQHEITQSEFLPKRLSLFKRQLKIKLGQTDLLKTNRNLMNLKASFESERGRFYSRIDAEKLDPYLLKQKKEEYAHSVKDKMAQRRIKVPIVTTTPPIEIESKEIEHSQRELMKNILQNYTKSEDPNKQTKVKQILMNRQMKDNEFTSNTSIRSS